MADSLSSIDCAETRRFWNWQHPNVSGNTLAGRTLSVGYSCVSDVCVALTDDSGDMPLVEGTDYTVNQATGRIKFLAGGATAFFITSSTIVTVWFNVLVCPADITCVEPPCCGNDPFTSYRSVRPCTSEATVTISPMSGEVLEFPVTVTLTSSRDDATIYYTLDGSDPDQESNIYTGPFVVTDPSTVVMAVAIVESCGPPESVVEVWGPEGGDSAWGNEVEDAAFGKEQ